MLKKSAAFYGSEGGSIMRYKKKSRRLYVLKGTCSLEQWQRLQQQIEELAHLKWR